MKTPHLILIAALALALPTMGCKKAEKTATETKASPNTAVELNLKWPSGRHTVQSIDIKQATEMNLPGMTTPMKQDMTMGQRYGITVAKELPEGKHEVTMEYLQMAMNMSMGGKPMLDFDSSKKSTGAANPVADTLKKMIGAKLVFVLDASNHVESVQGADELQAKLTASAGNDPTGIIKGMVNPDTMKQMMEAGVNLPGKPVQPGDTWPVQRDFSVGSMGTLSMDATYTLVNFEKHLERDCAHLTMEGTMKAKEGSKMVMKGMSIAIRDGKLTGDTWFDLDGGMFLDAALNQDLNMDITMPNPMAGKQPGATKTLAMQSTMHQIINTKQELK